MITRRSEKNPGRLSSQSSSYSSGIIRSSTSSSIQPEENSESVQNQKIARLLAVRSYHLPGYNCCRDYISWFNNNHPLLGLCCRHRLNPIGTGPRVIILFSSIFFGLIVTNLVYLFFRYNDGDNHSIIQINIGEDPNAYLSRFEVSTESVVLWTLGGIIHSIVDLALWHLTACACCLPGAFCSSKLCSCCVNIGSYITVLIFFALTSMATLVILLRATFEEKGGVISNSTILDDDNFIEVTSLTSFNFLVTFVVQLLLTYLLWGPLVSTVLFLGALRGCIPCLDSRPKEVERQRAAASEGGNMVS